MTASDAMVRWQEYARESRTAVNSHFLTYAGAILALQATVLLDKDVPKILFHCLFIWSGILASFSLALGSIVVLIRLRDARLTARITRYKDLGKPETEIDEIRKNANYCSWWVNRLLPMQVIVFGLSAALFVAWIFNEHSGKLIYTT